MTKTLEDYGITARLPVVQTIVVDGWKPERGAYYLALWDGVAPVRIVDSVGWVIFAGNGTVLERFAPANLDAAVAVLLTIAGGRPIYYYDPDGEELINVDEVAEYVRYLIRDSLPLDCDVE